MISFAPFVFNKRTIGGYTLQDSTKGMDVSHLKILHSSMLELVSTFEALKDVPFPSSAYFMLKDRV